MRKSDSIISTNIFLGCDTETYYENNHIKGLKSIQLYGFDGENKIEKYLLPDTFDFPDAMIRMDIARKFFDFLETLKRDTEIAFFNMNFDVSQFLYYMINQSGYKIMTLDNITFNNIPKGSIVILESDVKLYSISIRTKTHGRLIRMIDIANFIPASTLNKVSLDFIGEQKIEIESKTFPKRFPTDLEKTYAMKDAELTYKLLLELKKVKIIEGHKYVSIAGRALGHFKDYLKENYRLTLDQYFFNTDDKIKIQEYKNQFEEVLRPCLRGGITMALRTGFFQNCKHIDARSMYPSQCVLDFIPYGEILNEKPTDSLSTGLIFPIGFFELKKGKIPYFQWRRISQCERYFYKNKYNAGEYVKDCFLDGSYGLWFDEWEIVKECYKISNLDESKKVYFRLMENVALKNYINMLYEGKKNNVGSKRLAYKYLLNSLYGKFLSNPNGTSIIYENGERKKIEENNRKTYYLPIGSWIAMLGRVTLMQAMLSLPVENVLYCDTDSIIYTKNKDPNVKIGKNLREWGIEHDSVNVFIVGPKTYQEYDLNNNELITKCAGMPKNIIAKQKFGDLIEGKSYSCRKPRRDLTSWAINFEDTEYTINTRAQIFRGH